MVTHGPPGAVDGFDPFSSRQDRDLRNQLGAGFLEVLHGGRTSSPVPAEVLQRWREAHLSPAARRYLEARINAYRGVSDAIRRRGRPADDVIAMMLWNEGLFFECHEWLETFWHRASGPRKTALQGWILAAGAFSQKQAGRNDAARSLALRAATRLASAGPHLPLLGNMDAMIRGLEKIPPVAVPLAWTT